MDTSTVAGRRVESSWIGVMLAVVVLSLAGCAGPNGDELPPDDEAMQRAKFEGKKPEDAAYEYFYPKKIVNYFPGMDVASRPEKPDQLRDLLPTVEQQRALSPKPMAEEFTGNETLGRNTWMIWCAGNESFWDWLSNNSVGLTDLIKVLDSRKHATRFDEAGLINEPEMTAARSTDEFGLWLDSPADPTIQAWRRKYVKESFEQLGERKHVSQRGQAGYRGGREVPTDGDGYYGYYADEYGDSADKPVPPAPPSIYGLSSGVVGLRLFPNPNFDATARKNWDAKRYYDDPDYYRNPKLVRPYRVGMSCAFCHASFHPLNPPRDMTTPQWANISGNIGAQYLRIRSIFGNLLGKDNFVWHLLDSEPPGTVDTSLIATDNINNSNTMNSVFNLPQRAIVSLKNPQEDIGASSAMLPSIWRHPELNPPTGAKDVVPPAWRETLEKLKLTSELEGSNSDPRRTPRILLDGADSIGAWGALARVYLNIGSYSEQWNRLHQPLLGFSMAQRPFTIDDCVKHSVYWHATELRVGPLRDYFLKATPPMPLLATDGAETRLQPIDEAALKKAADAKKVELSTSLATERRRRVNVDLLKRGRRVFAQNCIVCHSSIQDDEGRRHKEMEEYAKIGEFWDHDPGRWLSDDKYKEWALAVVETDDFWKNNYLSTDYRVPITLVRTNASRALGTNALTGHMWADFSSISYRQMPSVGAIKYFDPFEQKEKEFFPRHKAPMGAPPQGGGPGFYRVPTLVSIWATAPFLHNNSLGNFNNDPSIDGRLVAFDDAIQKMLWPEKRWQSSSYNEATPERLAQDHGLIWRTTEESYLRIPNRHVPYLLEQVPIVRQFKEWFPWIEQVWPLWLPSAILLAGSYLILLLLCEKSRKKLGWGFVVAAVLVCLVQLIASGQFGSLSSTLLEPVKMWINRVRPVCLPIWLLLGMGVIVLLPLSAKWHRRIAGYGTLGLGLLLGGIVYFNAGELGDLKIGPIPKGTPVSLLANLNPEADPKELKRALAITTGALAEIESRHLSGEEAQQVLRQKAGPALMKVNKCPDFVMDHGHYFEWFKTMSDDDKEALIELLKTF